MTVPSSTGAPSIAARIVDEPIDPGDFLHGMGTDADGAVLLFLGVVRNHADGRAVTGMDYDAYREMAEEVLREIVAEAAQELDAGRVAAVHRIGELAVGEVSVAIAAASPHRAPAFEASRYVIEEIKKRLPVWKREHYVEGEASWVEGRTPPSSGESGVEGGKPPAPATAEAGEAP